MQVLTTPPSKRGRNEGRPKLTKIQRIDENKESFRNFISKYRNSPVSRKSYIDWLKRLVEYCNLPDVRARIGIAIGDNTDLLLFDKDAQNIQNLLKRFIDYEYEVRHLSPVSVHKHYVAIKQFYESNEVVLNWRIINNYVGSYNNMKRGIDLPYTYEEIHKMLDKADERNKCLVCFRCQLLPDNFITY